MKRITALVLLAGASLPFSAIAASATGTVTVNVLAPISLSAPEINFGNVHQGQSAQVEVPIHLSAAASHNVVLDSQHNCDATLRFSLPKQTKVITTGSEQVVKLPAVLSPLIDPQALGLQSCNYTITANYL